MSLDMSNATNKELEAPIKRECLWVNCGFSSCFVATWHSTSHKLDQLQGQALRQKSPARPFCINVLLNKTNDILQHEDTSSRQAHFHEPGKLNQPTNLGYKIFYWKFMYHLRLSQTSLRKVPDTTPQRSFLSAAAAAENLTI